MLEILGIADLTDLKSVWKHPLEFEAAKYIARIRSTDETAISILGGEKIKALDLNLLEFAIWSKKYDAFNILIRRFCAEMFNTPHLL